MTTELLGPYAEAREWLLQYMSTARFKNTMLEGSLRADWTNFHREHAAYVLGAIWGRLRQTDSSLEDASEYAELVQAEFEDTTNSPEEN